MLVYFTEHGSHYHVDEDCRYLWEGYVSHDASEEPEGDVLYITKTESGTSYSLDPCSRCVDGIMEE